MIHPQLFNFDINSLNLSQFGRDDNYISDANSAGDWYEEHTFFINNKWFDQISMRVWEHDGGKPEYVWLFRQECTIEELKAFCAELSKAYGESSYRPEDAITELTTGYHERWKYVWLDFTKREKPELTVTFRYSTIDKTTGEQ